MTTNGALLAAQARTLKDAGLARVTVSLDALDDAVFRAMNDVDFPVGRVLDGIETALAAGLAPVKVNAVIDKTRNAHQILPLARHFRHSGVNLRFIEYMDVGGADGWVLDQVVTAAEMHALIEAEFALVPQPGRVSDTADGFRYADGGGEVGFIASVSKPFCGDCTRARVSADGKLFLCLFGARSVDLRPWLRSGPTGQLEQTIRASWEARADRYSEQRCALRAEGAARRYPVVRMSLVGGVIAAAVAHDRTDLEAGRFLLRGIARDCAAHGRVFCHRIPHVCDGRWAAPGAVRTEAGTLREYSSPITSAIRTRPEIGIRPRFDDCQATSSLSRCASRSSTWLSPQ